MKGDSLSEQQFGSRPACRVLVVDDNRDATDSLSTFFKLRGHESRTAYDGRDAVEVAKAFRPDAVVLDLQMPRMNGHEAARQIRQQPWASRVPLIALSAWGTEGDSKPLNHSFNYQFLKPVDPGELERLLVAICRAGT